MRAQVGIGTLIIFISMVLIAAIAAGVLVSTAGSLQSKSEETGSEASTQVTNRLQVVAVSGSAISGASRGRVNVTVKKAPGSGNIDLENTTVSWVGPSGSYNLVENDVDAANADGEFYASRVTDPDDSHPVLNQRDDRVVVVFDVGTDDFTNGGLGEVGSRLTEGASATLTVTTKSGGQTQVTMVVPESPSGKNAGNL